MGLLLSNSVLVILIKELSNIPYMKGSLWDSGSMLFYTFFYGSVMLILLLSRVLQRTEKKTSFQKALFPGIMAGIGSSAGMYLVGIVISTGIPAGRSFPVISVVSILTGSVAAVIFFNEKITRTFVIGNIFALTSIISTSLV
jgi:drug/metabolite transporter (DMT)-like permease